MKKPSLHQGTIGHKKASPLLATTDPKDKDSKGNISASAKLDKRDDAILAKHIDKDKAGGKGSRPEDKAGVVKAQRRSVVKGSYQKTKKELRKEVNLSDKQKGKGGVFSKIKTALTSKEKLRSKATATRLKDVKTATGQAMSSKTVKSLGGDKYTGVKQKNN